MSKEKLNNKASRKAINMTVAVICYIFIVFHTYVAIDSINLYVSSKDAEYCMLALASVSCAIIFLIEFIKSIRRWIF